MLAEEMTLFVEANYTNPFFGLEDVAQRFSLSVSGASRVAKSILGTILSVTS